MTWLAEQGASDPDVRVVRVGSSAATGGYDEWSDLDIVLLCTPGQADAVHDRLVACARGAFAVDQVWELPKATWPDGRQCFVNLQARPGALEEPTRIVDLHISEFSDAHRFVDVRRHGIPIVVHNPDGLVELRHDDEEAMAISIAEGVDQVRQRRATAEWLVNRALRRGQLPDAVHLYLGFGLRYLHTDLPATWPSGSPPWCRATGSSPSRPPPVSRGPTSCSPPEGWPRAGQGPNSGASTGGARGGRTGGTRPPARAG